MFMSTIKSVISNPRRDLILANSKEFAFIPDISLSEYARMESYAQQYPWMKIPEKYNKIKERLLEKHDMTESDFNYLVEYENNFYTRFIDTLRESYVKLADIFNFHETTNESNTEPTELNIAIVDEDEEDTTDKVLHTTPLQQDTVNRAINNETVEPKKSKGKVASKTLETLIDLEESKQEKTNNVTEPVTVDAKDIKPKEMLPLFKDADLNPVNFYLSSLNGYSLIEPDAFIQLVEKQDLKSIVTSLDYARIINDDIIGIRSGLGSSKTPLTKKETKEAIDSFKFNIERIFSDYFAARNKINDTLYHPLSDIAENLQKLNPVIDTTTGKMYTLFTKLDENVMDPTDEMMRDQIIRKYPDAALGLIKDVVTSCSDLNVKFEDLGSGRIMVFVYDLTTDYPERTIIIDCEGGLRKGWALTWAKADEANDPSKVKLFNPHTVCTFLAGERS